MHSLGAPYSTSLELVSYHSVSKGVSGECGLRGGYCQLTNIHEGAFQELYKLASVNLCPNTMGQVRGERRGLEGEGCRRRGGGGGDVAPVPTAWDR
jgi:aspartate/methionine/tyrosine aminotransferase